MRAAVIAVVLCFIVVARYYGASASAIARDIPNGPLLSDVKTTIAMLSAGN